MKQIVVELLVLTDGSVDELVIARLIMDTIQEKYQNELRWRVAAYTVSKRLD